MKRSMLCGLLILALLFPSFSLATKYDFEYTSLKQLLKVSDLVVMGRPVSVTRQGDGRSIYKIAVEQTFWGKENINLDLYTLSELLHIGQEYVLFIEHDDNPFWVGPVLRLIDYESFFRVAKGRIEVPERFTDLKNGISIAGFVKRAAGLKRSVKPKAPAAAIVQTLAINELIDKSDSIFIGKVLQVEYSTVFAAGYAAVQVVEPFKGLLDRVQIHIHVPQGVEADQTYLFFRTQGLDSMPSRSNSILRQGSADYDEALRQLRHPQDQSRANKAFGNLYPRWIGKEIDWPYDFAGSWITPDNHMAISLVGASEARKKEIAAISGDPGVIIFFEAKYAYNTLYDLASEIYKNYGEANNPAAQPVPVGMTSVNQMKNVIDIEVWPKYLATAKAYFSAQYGDRVEVIEWLGPDELVTQNP